MGGQSTIATRGLVLGEAEDVRRAAEALDEGAAVAHGFGTSYALTARPDREVVERVNRMKGCPADRVTGVTTVPERVGSLFDWTRLPSELPRRQIEDLVDELLHLGPFGLRGPAAAHIPPHLTAVRQGVETVRVIAPGHSCPSNAFLAEALVRTGTGFLAVTSANRSRHLTGTDDEPAHWRADGVIADFGHEPDVQVLAHDDEAAARRRHPHHTTTATTVLSFHHTPGHGRSGMPALTLERHGSLSADHTRSVAANHGFTLTLAPQAERRLTARAYPN
ncbi:L-threonylcarbamoyladenylate synthase [Streptomyces sp. NPDC059534]|uniref:L-threonylcarbamoyladenylate synthase n=1 Tax=Streptomyces sp. NPDC059534 TaxID=3346859 RepID=UPI0036809F02